MRPKFPTMDLKEAIYTRRAVRAFTAEAVDEKVLRWTGGQLEKLLKRSDSTVTLRIEELHHRHVRQIRRLLRTLSRYGDRVSICVAEKVQGLVEIDSSIYHVQM